MSDDGEVWPRTKGWHSMELKLDSANGAKRLRKAIDCIEEILEARDYARRCICRRVEIAAI